MLAAILTIATFAGGLTTSTIALRRWAARNAAMRAQRWANRK